MTGGCAIFGSGPGVLASDDPARPSGRGNRHHPPAIQRQARHHQSDWFTMNDAALQILPPREEMPFVVASQISPLRMTLAGKYGIGIISLGSMSTQKKAAAALPLTGPGRVAIPLVNAPDLRK
jgi:limonene 1,2-monooxygenase